MRTRGALLGWFLGVGAGIALAAYIGTDDLWMLPFYQIVIFSLGFLFLFGLFVALGAMLGGCFVDGREELSEGAQGALASEKPGVETVGSPERDSRWVSFGVRSAKWGWIFGLCAILLTALSGLSITTSVTSVPLIVAVPLVFLGGVCAFIALVTVFFKPTLELGIHITAGAAVNSVCLLLMVFCIFLIVGYKGARAEHEKRMATGQSRTPPSRHDRDRPVVSPRASVAAKTPKRAPPKPLTLQEAVAQNKASEVERYAQEGANLNEVYRDGQTLLIRATTRGHADVVLVLLDHGADVNGNPKARLYPLSLALQQNRPVLAEMILRHEPDVNATDGRGYTPLHYAVLKGYESIVQTLLEQGASFDTPAPEQCRVLELAIDEDQASIAEMLLEYGADPNAMDRQGRTMLHLAVEKKRVKVAKVLIDRGADVDAKLPGLNRGAVDLALQKRNRPLAELLLKNGAKPYVGRFGESPICLAFRTNDWETMRLLVQYGIGFDRSETKKLVDRLTTIMRSSDQVRQKMLLGDRDELFGEDAKQLLLYACAAAGKADHVEELLEAGADVGWEYTGCPAILNVAISSKDMTTVQTLLDAGAVIVPYSTKSAAENSGSSAILELVQKQAIERKLPEYLKVESPPPAPGEYAVQIESTRHVSAEDEERIRKPLLEYLGKVGPFPTNTVTTVELFLEMEQRNAVDFRLGRHSFSAKDATATWQIHIRRSIDSSRPKKWNLFSDQITMTSMEALGESPEGPRSALTSAQIEDILFAAAMEKVCAWRIPENLFEEQEKEDQKEVEEEK